LKGFLAVDIGASGGKAFVGRYDGERLSIEEVSRFANRPVSVNGQTHWNILSLYDNTLESIMKAIDSGVELKSVGVDTWGVDFGLLDGSGELLGNPRHYRDMFGDDSMEYAVGLAGRDWLFERSPTQFQPFNTLFQLISMKRRGCGALKAADSLLPISSLISYFLSGEKLTEFTFATTTQIFDPVAGDWCEEIIDLFSLPDIFTPIVPAGTVIGRVTPSLSSELSTNLKVVLPATHDTASAVASIPLSGRTMFVSAGTWCLEGVVLDEPVLDREVLELNFANEGCYGGKYRLLKNATGLWLVQELLREWKAKDPSLDYPSLVRMAGEARPFSGKIDVESPRFKKPLSMERAILQECAEIGSVPSTRGEIVRTALEGIATMTELTRKELERLTGRIDGLHIVGGGVKNQLLCQLIADFTGLPITAGPVEGTAIGNIIVQMFALGELKDPGESIELLKRSFEMRSYEPRNP
jgi:rhamnulokinase